MTVGETTHFKTKHMTLGSKELYDMMDQFEKDSEHMRGYFVSDFTRETKERWANSVFYQNGAVNQLFSAYRLGYSFAKSVYEN